MKLPCPKCANTFKGKQGLAVHIARAHSKRGKTWGKAKAKTAKPVRTPVAQNIVINFCPHCGHQIPNAILN